MWGGRRVGVGGIPGLRRTILERAAAQFESVSKFLAGRLQFN
jgi:hypothetical protein